MNKLYVAPTAPGALPGWEVTCPKCGETYKASLESLVDLFISEHGAWHWRKEHEVLTGWKALDDHYVFAVPTMGTFAKGLRPRCPRNMGFHALYNADLTQALVITRSAVLLKRGYAKLVGVAKYQYGAPKDANILALLTR